MPGDIMDTKWILAELHAELDRVNRAITALENLSSNEAPIGRRGRATTSRSKGRGGMSAAARRKLSQLLKQRWAQGKMSRSKTTTTRTFKPGTRRMSQAGRKRIAAAQRLRWAKVRAQKAQKAA